MTVTSGDDGLLLKQLPFRTGLEYGRARHELIGAGYDVRKKY